MKLVIDINGHFNNTQKFTYHSYTIRDTNNLDNTVSVVYLDIESNVSREITLREALDLYLGKELLGVFKTDSGKYEIYPLSKQVWQLISVSDGFTQLNTPKFSTYDNAFNYIADKYAEHCSKISHTSKGFGSLRLNNGTCVAIINYGSKLKQLDDVGLFWEFKDDIGVWYNLFGVYIHLLTNMDTQDFEYLYVIDGNHSIYSLDLNKEIRILITKECILGGVEYVRAKRSKIR
jgi:hypothetical protein